EETQKVVEALKKMGAPIDRIIHSGKKRAEQTALIMQKNLAPDCPVEVRNDIAPNDPVEPIFKAIHTFKRDVMIVGHLPLLPKLVSRLVAKSEHPVIIHFKESTVAVLEKCPDGSWRLEALLSPETL
ncbi:MAG: hypothetical protein K8I00_05735, partial [Candidatus Omnitrophica bacterium]|nr:hypothetical protein [Candidatus Omnitrophota bacterium]